MIKVVKSVNLVTSFVRHIVNNRVSHSLCASSPQTFAHIQKIYSASDPMTKVFSRPHLFKERTDALLIVQVVDGLREEWSDRKLGNLPSHGALLVKRHRV